MSYTIHHDVAVCPPLKTAVLFSKEWGSMDVTLPTSILGRGGGGCGGGRGAGGVVVGGSGGGSPRRAVPGGHPPLPVHGGI